MSEGRRIADEWVDRLEDWDWPRLDALSSRGAELEEHVTGPSGGRYRVRADTFWDIDPWKSDLFVKVRVYPERGLRRWFPFRGTGLKPGEQLPEEPPSG